MVLKSLEMQGFKSFPDKTVLNFGKGITAVVGPNGSGKSNISDGVRWVLGEQRTKSLRGSKMEDVIFGGTSTRRPVGFAQVTLTLDNSDKTLRERKELVSVSRRYYRSGESEYKIDGEIVRRKDVRELFMDTGLGADGYSIVGQGKIDSIISAKNEDRREIFEEAAGISKFRSKRTDAQRRLDQAQENLVRLLDILDELEGRVEPLRVQSEKATKFIEYAEEKKELEIGLWLYKINRFTQEMREQDRKIESASLSYNNAEKELEDIEKEIEEIIEKGQKIAIEIDEIRRSSSLLEEEALRQDGEIQVLKNNILHNNETTVRIRNEMENASGETNVIDTQIKEKQTLMAQSDVIITQNKSLLQKATTEIENIQMENSASVQQSSEKAKALAALNMQLSEYRVKQSRAHSSIEEIKGRQDTVNSAIEQSKIALVDIKNQKSECKKNVEFLLERIDELTNVLNGCVIGAKQREEKAQKAKIDLDNITMQFEQKRQRAKMLRELEKNMDGYTGAVKLVMKQAHSNALAGILGPVSQLINVEKNYAVAIETALGMAMQNIVTENEADAKRAIYFLKQNKAGRATFLPISAIKGRSLSEKGLEEAVGYIDIAENLVKCDKKYQAIISSLLGKTVICEDMDSAIGISKRYNYRFRIVTLDGQIINAGGSMTGGSKASNTGFISRATEVEKLEKEAAELESELTEQKEKLKISLEGIALAKANLEGAQADLANGNEDKIRAEGEEKLISQQLESGEVTLAALIDEQANAASRVDTFTLAAKNAEQIIEKAAEEINQIHGELDEITDFSEELGKKRDELTAKISKINLVIMTAEKDMENARLSIGELNERKMSQSGKLVTIQSEIDAINANSEKIKLEIISLEQATEKLRGESLTTKKSIDDFNLKKNECEKRSGELRLIERSKTAEREKLSTELGRLEERRNSMDKEYEETVNKLYDEYQLTKAQAAQVGKTVDDISKTTRRLNELKSSIRGLGNVNVGAIEEYKEVSQRYIFMKEQIDDVEKSRKELAKIIDELTSSMSEIFLDKFNKIAEQFVTCFSDFFGGGTGEIVLEDMNDVLECAIEIKIQPPGKSVQNITLFSGGEKSLAALSLLFAILKVTPSPFCIYDEVEAALDDANVERFAKYMRKMTDKIQFISITHRRGTMEEADVLYGVTMQEKGVSKLLELQTTQIADQLGLK